MVKEESSKLQKGKNVGMGKMRVNIICSTSHSFLKSYLTAEAKIITPIDMVLNL